MQLHTFCNEVYSFLGLKRPFEIRIKSKAHKDNWAGYCLQHTRKGEITKHIIGVYIPGIVYSDFDFYSVIAHEFIHAWQAEKGLIIGTAFHNPIFQNKAQEITNFFRFVHGIELLQVYSPESDIDDYSLD